MKNISFPGRWAVASAVFILVADQVSKFVIKSSVPLHDSVEVFSGLFGKAGFSISHIRNIGAAWGMLPGMRYGFVALALALVAFMTVKYRKIFVRGDALDAATYALFAGGVLGNMLDRLVYGYVTDFLDFYWGASHFPSFNVADSAICVGFVLYMVSQYRAGAASPRPEGAD